MKKAQITPITAKKADNQDAQSNGQKATPKPRTTNSLTTSTRPLTRKQQAFIKHLIDNPKASATQAVLATYGKPDKPPTYITARNIASENLTKPNIINVLERNTELFESTVVNTVKDWGNSDNTRRRELALQASYWGHDKIHGKATQKIEQRTTGVKLVIDLTSALKEEQTYPQV